MLDPGQMVTMGGSHPQDGPRQDGVEGRQTHLGEQVGGRPIDGCTPEIFLG